MVKLIKHDLEFILKQIKIAERHAGGEDLATLVGEAGGIDPDGANAATQAALLPYGLRTVDGSYNNLIPGREMWGASGQTFPGIFEPNYLNEDDGDSLTFGPGMTYDNNDYGNAGGDVGGMPGNGTVIDADPRIISNLIVDQSLANPAAIMAGLQHAGVSGAALTTALNAITTAYAAIEPLASAVTAANAAAQIAHLEADSNMDPVLEPGFAAAAAAADANVVAAELALDTASTALDTLLADNGIEMDGPSILLPNVSPDEGLSSPFNGWMTIFGQFFDHGLDLVAKGGNGTVYVPLQPGDPLYVEGSHTNFMALTRVTVDAGADGVLGTSDDIAAPKNLTTPWVDQNQTYGSTASKQIFMREYVATADGRPIATGLLLEGSTGGAGGTKGGLATWADVKAQARELLGINLTDADVGNIPLIAADEYGNFILGANGFPQVVTGVFNAETGLLEDVLVEGDPSANGGMGIDIPSTALRTGHAFLDDIAHAAAPVFLDNGDLVVDADDAIGNTDEPGSQSYDNELLDAHYIAGDGRANENIALTAVHHVFHTEHNRIVEHTKDVVLESGDLEFLNEWLLEDLTAWPSEAQIADLVWNGERLFQAGRFTTEMEYQHLVFEEFGRMMQPDIDVFVFEPSVDINPNIAAEFAHVVYRFGHSMLREDIARITIGPDGNPVQDDVALIEGFLNPIEFASMGDADAAAGAIIRGMSRQTGSEIDEFVTGALRNNLLGLPLDLATINLARGRDVGTPSLNAARTTFYEATQDTQLKPYSSWADFALNLKNPASIINFIAAYGTHASLVGTEAAPLSLSAAEKREAATLLVLGSAGETPEARADRLAFLNAPAEGSGLNDVDFWIGGLAEKKMAFGGMLGSTFSFVFEMTMENLQDADRFYYLSRTQGLNLLNELENNSFAELVMRTTDLGDADSTVLPGNLFSGFDMPTIEMDMSKQMGPDPVHDDPTLQAISSLVERRDADGNLITDTTTVASSIRINSNEHFTIGGTDNADTIIAGGGDDAVWGKGGDDTIEAGYGVDKVFGGEGDDIITNSGTDIGEVDFLHGNEGNDAIHGGSGLALIFGNDGSDFIIAGPDGKEVFGGTGNDFVRGGDGSDFLLGNEGDDWLEGGERLDTLAGENSELMFNSSIIGHDVLNGGGNDTDYDGESGDDIMVQGSGIQRSNGMAGFDWAIHKGDAIAANSDLGIPVFATQEAFILRDRFDLVEGLSGWKHDDVLTGRIEPVNTRAEATGTAAIPGEDAPLDSYSNALLEKNVDMIAGLRELVSHIDRTMQTGEDGVEEEVVMDTADASDILLGGGGSDTIKGLAGDDTIDGDKWLNVRIEVLNADGSLAATADGMTGKLYKSAAGLAAGDESDLLTADGKTLQSAIFDRTFNAGQLNIVREIVDGNVEGDVDIAVYTDIRENYTITTNEDGSLTVEHTGFDEADGDGNVEGEERRPVSDGRDTLRNIEILRFSDGDYPVDQPPTGLPLISDITPTQDQALTVDLSDVIDPNGIDAATLEYQWQVLGADWTDIGGATGASFTPSISQINLPLRVVVSYIDNTGNPETVISEMTAPVGVHYVGTNAANIFSGSDNADLIDGGGGADTLNGNGGDDVLNGGNAVDSLNGDAGDDILNGDNGNDTLNGGAGDDWLEGGAGTDTADYSGAAGNYSIDVSGTNILVTDNIGTDGTDTLTGIERLSFNGVNYAIVAGTDLNNNNLNGATGAGGAQAVFGFAGNDAINGGAGNDLIHGGDGDDIVTQTGSTGGRDIVSGGDGADTYQVNGVAAAEIFRIYSREAALSGPNAIAGLTAANLKADTEILITRTTGAGAVSVASIIAELDTIEELRVNALQVTSPAGEGGGSNGGDTIQVIGDFTGTSLNFETITIDGSEDGDFIDISALTSAHRIVFRSNGGNDTIVGTLRPQDVIELPDGATQDDYVIETGEDGVTTMTSPIHTLWFTSPDGLPQFTSGADEDGQDDDHEHDHNDDHEDDDHDHDDHDDDDDDHHEDEDDHHDDDDYHHDDDDDEDEDEDSGDEDDTDGEEGPAPSPATSGVGTAGADVLTGTEAGEQLLGLGGDDVVIGYAGADLMLGGDGNDFLAGWDGNDVVFGGTGEDHVFGGNDADMLYGDAGADRVFGEAGNDLIEAGAGDDTVVGGAGNDRIAASSGDGDDVYFGDEMNGGAGIDTLDMSTVTADAEVDLGTGLDGHGSAQSDQTGSDSLWGIENVLAGSGNDTIVASGSVNVMDGGAGDDTFVFNSAGDADGDTIVGFETGDRIDLSGIDADTGTGGNQGFTLVPGTTPSAAGQVTVTHEKIGDVDHTIVSGTTDDDGAAAFRINIRGTHDLTASDFTL